MKIINLTKSAIESNIERLASCFCNDDQEWNEELEREIKAFEQCLEHGSCFIGNTKFELSSLTSKGFGFRV